MCLIPPYFVHVQVPVLVVRGRRLLCGEAGEEGRVGQVESGRVDPEVFGDSSADLEKTNIADSTQITLGTN